MRARPSGKTGAGRRTVERQKAVIARIIKAALVLGILGLAGLSAYAYLADLAPVQSEVSVPVTLNAD